MKLNLTVSMRPSKASPSWIRYAAAVCLLLLLNVANAAPPPAGTAPVTDPPGGFGIEGDLLADSPVAGLGDWVPGPNGAGQAVLDANGVPINPTTTFHFIDPFNASDDLTFSGGLKWTDDPNDWTWTTGKASSKTDINNVLLHVAKDADGHTWVILATDRLSTSGDSYIDFELLQNPFYRTNNGAFFSLGPDGGRTVNDVLLSLAFTGGGSVPDFFAFRWQGSNGKFAYVDSTTSLPTGRVFVAANATNTIVPFGAFGDTNYVANAFAEAAIDLTAFLGNFDTCLSIGIKTIMVKTKSSASSSASIIDFIDPIQYDMKLGPSANAGPDLARCIEGDSTSFPLNGQAAAGLFPIASTTWSVVSGTAVIDDPSSLVTTAHVTSASATLRLTVVQGNECTESDDVVLTVAPLPACSIAGPATVCPLSTSQYAGPAGSVRYAWSVDGNASIVGPTNAQVVTVAASPDCEGTFTLRLTSASSLCESSCTTDVLIQDTNAPVVTAPPDLVLECPADTRTNLTGVASAQDDCGNVTVTFNDAVTAVCGGSKIIARTWTASDLCGNSASAVQTITVRDTTPPTLGLPQNLVLECPADTRTNVTGVPVAQDACGSVAVSFSDVVSNTCGGAQVIARLWTAVDECGNSTNGLQTITVRDTNPPSLVLPANVVLECPADTGTNATGLATAVDGCGSVTITFSDSVTDDCGGSKAIARTWTATDECGNSTNGVQLITVHDTTAPSLNVPADLVLECPTDTTTNRTGMATAQDGCGSVTVTFSDIVSNSCGGTKVISRLWTATDECGNSTNRMQTITVRDTTPPALSVPGNIVLECPTEPTTNLTGVAVAQDACGSVAVSFSDLVSNICGGAKMVYLTWTAVDASGNATNGLQTITIQDTTPPVLTAPQDLVLECPADTTTNRTGVATAQDGCGTVTVRYSDGVSNVCGGAKVIRRLWTATDQCGNSTDALQTITVQDTTPPSLVCPSDLVLECPADTRTNATGVPIIQDTCGSVALRYTDTVTNGCGGSKVISRLWTATDQCGNSTNGVQTITVRDTTPPAIKLPANLVLECPGDTRTNVTGVPIVQDGCGSSTVTYSDVVTNGCGATRTVLRLWTATDQCGNTTNGLQTIAVVDTKPPKITCPNIAVQCPGDIPTAYTNLESFLAAGGTAVDACDPAVTFSLVSDSGLVGSCPGKITRVYRVTDSCGNSADGTQTIIVDDTIAPVLTVPTNLTLECGMTLDPTATGNATATDNCSTNVSVSYTDAVVPSQYNIKWYAADPNFDHAPYLPGYLKLGPASLSCLEEARSTGRAIDPLRNAVAFGPTGSTLDALTSLGAEPMALGQIVPFEAVIEVSGGGTGPEQGTIEFTATWSTHTTSNDDFGYDRNYMVYCAFVDYADPGTIDPNYNAKVESYHSVLTEPGDVDEQIQGTFRVSGLDTGDRVIVEIWVVLDSTTPRNFGGTIASDLVSAQKATSPPESITTGAQTVSIGNLSKIGALPDPQPQPPAPPLPPQPPIPPGGLIQVVDRTWRATDDCGNQRTAVQRFTVRDTTAPGLTIPADVVLEFPADTSTNGTGTAQALDTCGSSSISYTDIITNGCGGSQVITRTWTAVDASGNQTNAVQTIQVLDATPPALTMPADLVLEYPAQTGTNVTGAASAQDASGAVEITFSDSVTNPCGSTEVISRLWTATDLCGNSTNAVQTIAVVDTTAPTITGPPDRVLECTDDPSPANTGTAVAQDSGGPVTVTFSDTVSNSCGTARIISRLWTATDACGNSATALQTISVRDTMPPTLIAPADVVLEYPADTSTNATGTATAQDACGTAVVAYSDVVSNCCGNTSVILRTWTASDPCGNSASAIQSITVRDSTPPIISYSLVDTLGVDDYLQGSKGPILQDHFLTTFPNGLRIGLLGDKGSDLGSHALLWTANADGLSAMKAALSQASLDSGTLSQTATNSTLLYGGGELARQALVLTLNIGFNSAGALGAGPNNFGSLIYTAPGDSLSGLSVSSLLDTANRALAGLGLPADHDFISLAGLLEQVNLAFNDKVKASWAADHLSTPMLVVQCAGQVPAPDASRATVSDAGDGEVAVRSLGDATSQYWNPSHYRITRTWVAEDACGNTSSCSFEILVEDTTPPTLKVNPDFTVQAGEPWDFGSPEASDNCGPVSLVVVHTGTNTVNGDTLITRTWEAVDFNGNNLSAQQTVTILAPTVPPVITSAPQSGTFDLGGSSSLTVIADGSEPLTYQWNLNGTAIPGATGSSFNPGQLGFTNAGVYTVTVGNSAGSVTSPAAVVNIAPIISAQLQGANLVLTWPGSFILQSSSNPGGPYLDVPGAVSPYSVSTTIASQKFFRLRSVPPDLTVSYSSSGQATLQVLGSPGLNYIIQATTDLVHWVNISTNTAPSTFVDPDAGQFPMRLYRVILLPMSSEPAPVLPSISLQPQGQNGILGSETVLTVAASGSGTLTYQWRLNGHDIPGATTSSLSISGLDLADAGLYTVVIGNAAGTIISSPAFISVVPTITARRVGNSLELTWPAPFILQAADTPSGPFTDLPGASSPYLYDTASLSPRRRNL